MFLNPLIAIQNQRQLKALKDKYQDQRCFIIGNGPSLKKHRLNLLKNEFTFVVNWFVLHSVFKKLKKAFYCVSDPQLWNYGQAFHPELIQKLSKNPHLLSLFFESSAKASYIKIRQQLPYQSFFLKLNRQKKASDGYFTADIWKSVYWGHSVIIEFCLPIAFHLGFKKVYLLGCDCDYKLDQDKSFAKSYFYPLTQIPKKDRQYQLKHLQPTSTNLPRWLTGYQAADKFFKKNQRKIFNAGKGGKLEVFPRVNYEKLFK